MKKASIFILASVMALSLGCTDTKQTSSIESSSESSEKEQSSFASSSSESTSKNQDSWTISSTSYKDYENYNSYIIDIPQKIDEYILSTIKWIDNDNAIIQYIIQIDKTHSTWKTMYLYYSNINKTMDKLFEGAIVSDIRFNVTVNANKIAITDKNILLLFEDKKCILQKEYETSLTCLHVSISPDFKKLIKIINGAKSITIYDFENGDEIADIPFTYSAGIEFIQWSKDSKSFVCNVNDEAAGYGFLLYNIETKTQSLFESIYYGEVINVKWYNDDNNILANLLSENTEPEEIVCKTFSMDVNQNKIELINSCSLYGISVAFAEPYICYLEYDSTNKIVDYVLFNINSKSKQRMLCDYNRIQFIDINNFGDILANYKNSDNSRTLHLYMRKQE